jgi:hypothetical protein
VESVRALPPPYAGATYDLLPVGTFVNDTHWQFTAKCTGCTTWTDESGNTKVLNPNTPHDLAWAYAVLPPETPGLNTSTFGFHDAHGTWSHDFTLGKNADFGGLVAEDIKPLPVPSATEEEACLFTWIPPAGAIIVTHTATVTRTVATATVTTVLTVTAAPTVCA